MVFDLYHMFDDAYYPWMHAPRKTIQMHENSIIARQRTAELIARHLWHTMEGVLTYDNQAHIVYRMIDVAKKFAPDDTIYIAVNMVIRAYNAEHSFKPDSQLYIDPI